MNIQVNGRRVDLQQANLTVAELLEIYNIQERISIVEHNKEIVSKKDYAHTNLESGDSLEIVHFVGGG